MQFFGIEEVKDLTKASQTTIEWASGSNLRIGGQAYSVTSVLTLDTATDIDTGAIASDTIYYIYAVVVAGTVSLKYSLSNSVPAGYSAYRLIGNFATDEISEIYETNIIAQPVAFLEDVKAEGSQGGTYTTGSFQTRTLNTLSGDIAAVGVTLSSNQFTLPTGKYLIEAYGRAFRVDNFVHRILNVDDSVGVLFGDIGYSAITSNSNDISHVRGVITITKETTFALQMNGRATRSTDGFGAAASGLGVDYKFAQVKITRMK